MFNPPTHNQSDKDNLRDDRVMNFIKQMVREKYGPSMSEDNLTKDAEMLYEMFTENLVSYFKPYVSEEANNRLDNLLKKSTDKDTVLAFLMESVDNFEQKIVQVLMDFRSSYLEDKNA